MGNKETSSRHRALQTIALIVILLIGVSLRLFLVHHGKTKLQLWGDEWQYHEIGWSLATGHGYRLCGHLTAGRVPVTPLLVAAIYASTGKYNEFYPQSAWAFLDIVNCLLVFALAVVVSRSRTIGVIAAAMYMFHPVFTRLSSHVLTEVPFIAMFLSSLLLLILYWRSKSWKLLCLSGMAMGLSMLSRPTTVLFPMIVIALMFVEARREKSPWIAMAVLYVIVTGAVVAPWTIRCSLLFKEFVPLSTYGGWGLWSGAGTGPHGEILMGPWVDKPAQKVVDTYSEVDADRYLKKEAIRVIMKDPLHWIALDIGKFFTLWFRMFKPESCTLLGILLGLSNLLILVFAWWGTRLTGNRMLMQLLISVFVYFSIMHMATYAELRYAAPAYAYMIPFATIGLIAWLSRFVPALRTIASEIRP